MFFLASLANSIHRAAQGGLRLGLAALALSACMVAGPTPGPASAPSMTLTDCQVSAPGMSSSLKGRCGTWPVLEDRANPAGRKLSLKVAVIPAVSRSPEPDPLFYLVGGPGQAATESFLPTAFDRVLQKRDIVLVDQRGTGQSNALRCPEPAETETAPVLDEAQIQAETEAHFKSCLAQLPGDPRFYTTSIAMQDLDEVRAALGYDKINLYGVSYGTRAAQTYLRLYPDRVRTVTLDGVVPQAEPLGLDVARDAQRALDLIFDRCAAEAGCGAAFPNVRAEFADVLAALEKEPAPVELAHPVTGRREAWRLTRAEVVMAVRLLSYAPETAALLPLLIHSAAQGDYGPLAAQSLMVSEDLARSLSIGMNLAVICAEDAPFLKAEAVAAANGDTYLQNAETDKIRQLCAIWPQGEIPADFKQPVTSAAPVLLLSGEADPVTPPSNAEEVAQTLANSLRVVVPGSGHNVIFRGCLSRVAADFIKAGSVQGLDTACAQEVSPLPFFTDFTGTQP